MTASCLTVLQDCFNHFEMGQSRRRVNWSIRGLTGDRKNFACLPCGPVRERLGHKAVSTSQKQLIICPSVLKFVKDLLRLREGRSNWEEMG